MKTTTLTFLTLLLLSCSGRKDSASRFTTDDIAMLQLNKTKNITILEEAGRTVDLAPFLKTREYNLSDMIQTMVLIPLETTEESLLHSIRNIIVTDSSIFVHDERGGGGVVLFDRQGKFVKRIKTGEGPEEIMRLSSITYNAFTSELLALNSIYLSHYTPKGDFIRKDRLPFFADEVVALPDGFCFYAISGTNNRHIDPYVLYQVMITDKEYALRSVGFPYTMQKDNYYDAFSKHMHYSDKGLYTTFKFSNTLYKYVKNNTFRKTCTLDFGRKGIPQKVLKKDYEQMMSAIEENDYAFFMGDYAENETHCYFRLLNLHKHLYYNVYMDKKNGKRLGGDQKTINRTNFPPINEPISTYDNAFVSYVYLTSEDVQMLTNAVLPDSVVNRLKTLTEEDNPVLMMYKLKPF